MCFERKKGESRRPSQFCAYQAGSQARRSTRVPADCTHSWCNDKFSSVTFLCLEVFLFGFGVCLFPYFWGEGGSVSLFCFILVLSLKNFKWTLSFKKQKTLQDFTLKSFNQTPALNYCVLYHQIVLFCLLTWFIRWNSGNLFQDS